MMPQVVLDLLAAGELPLQRLVQAGVLDHHRRQVGIYGKAVELPVVAREFAETSTGERDIESAAARLATLCPRAELIGITDGENGSWVFPRGGEPFHQPAFPVEKVIDTTGCGDVYHGAFLHALDRGLNYRKAAELASRAGAQNAGALGVRGALPTLVETTDTCA